MSFTKLTYIYCDFCSEGEPGTIVPVPDATVTEEREALRIEGWDHPRIRGGGGRVYDRCPDCRVANNRIVLAR